MLKNNPHNCCFQIQSLLYSSKRSLNAVVYQNVSKSRVDFNKYMYFTGLSQKCELDFFVREGCLLTQNLEISQRLAKLSSILCTYVSC